MTAESGARGGSRGGETPAGASPARVTMEDVARRAGVSRSLVSIAYRGVPGVSDETRDAIFEAARAIGYTPNSIASRLASRNRESVGFYLLDLRNSVYVDVFDGVREVTGERGTTVVLGVGETHGSEDRAGLTALMSSQADVIIATGLLLPDAEILELSRQRPLVSVTRQVPGVDSVSSDDEAGATLVTEHLLALGHRRIAHLAAPDIGGRSPRADAYARTMRKAGLEPRMLTAGFTQSSASAAARSLLSSPAPGERPTAIFATNDVTALGVIEAAHELGLRIPRDLSVAGYDDTAAAALAPISLTSVDQDARSLGRLAASAAFARLASPSAPVVARVQQPTLRPRRSTAPPPSAA
ncbi:LacI family DNA-binding transcriptional regulator [Frondihabitans cladoniiphilus]|uniref:LacI family DNA-binding transcriptional regulator n=1 Tax=Frondihabitans cladoniiphilus TaxID=715785 RepID=A0ABP8W1X3_9MICO